MMMVEGQPSSIPALALFDLNAHLPTFTSPFHLHWLLEVSKKLLVFVGPRHHVCSLAARALKRPTTGLAGNLEPTLPPSISSIPIFILSTHVANPSYPNRFPPPSLRCLCDSRASNSSTTTIPSSSRAPTSPLRPLVSSSWPPPPQLLRPSQSIPPAAACILSFVRLRRVTCSLPLLPPSLLVPPRARAFR